MVVERSNIFKVPKDVPEEIHPLMGLFMSYYIRTSKDSHNNSRDVQVAKAIMSKLWCFMRNLEGKEAREALKKYRRVQDRIDMLIKDVTKNDENIMTDKEQMELFVKKCEPKGKVIVAYLFREPSPQPIATTDETQCGDINVPLLILEDGSFAATSGENVFCDGKNKFCYLCKTQYQSPATHTAQCPQRCSNCYRMGRNHPCPIELLWIERIICEDCGIYFRNKDCYDHHLKSVCKKKKKCKICYAMYNTAAGKHKCGAVLCRNCNMRHKPNNKHRNEYHCYLRKNKINPRKDFARDLYFFMDCETTQKSKIINHGKRKFPPSETDQTETFEEYLEQNHRDLCVHDREPVPFAVPLDGDNEEICFIQDTPELIENLFEIAKCYISQPKTDIHEVNVVSAMHRCSECIYETDQNHVCQYCGSGKMKSWTCIPNPPPGRIFHKTPIDAFRDHLITTVKNLRKVISKAYVYSHNGSRFDSHLILSSFANRNIAPVIKMKGHTIFEAEIKKNSLIKKKILLRDSYRIAPIPLRSFQQTFGLPEAVHKFDFGHLFNKPEFYDAVLDTLPEKEFYNYSSMTKKQKADFDVKYDAENQRMKDEGRKYVMVDEIVKYCEQDVMVLHAGFIAYRKILNNLVEDEIKKVDQTKISKNARLDYFCCVTKGTTVASISMYLFKLLFMNNNELALVSDSGYQDLTNQSKIAIAYMDWLNKTPGVKINHRDNSPTGEYQFEKLSVDGFDDLNSKVYQIHGCRWHACPDCHQDETRVLFDNKTVAQIRAEDRQKTEDLLEACQANDYTLEIIWECDIRKQMEANDDMKKFINDHDDTSPLDLRKTLCGRTGPLRLDADAIIGEKEIKYFDICSLYPFACATGYYPTGHPTIKTNQPAYQSWEEIPELALIKCKLLPPRNCELPIIPMKENSQLLFSLCGKCPRELHDKNTERISCPHSDEDRQFVTSTTSLELIYAMKNGYEVKEVYHVLEYSSGSNLIFRDYVNTFLKIKVHASKPPANFDDPQVRYDFVKMYRDIYGVDIDPDKCAFNPGERYIAKLYLNSLWGRFSLQANQNQKSTLTQKGFDELVKDETVYNLSAHEISEDVIMASYTCDINTVSASNTSIVLSIWTTAIARLHLYRFMKKIHLHDGAILLYTDTDSVMYIYDILKGNPLEAGELLGEMTDEYPDKLIHSYRSTGPKAYHLELGSLNSDSTCSTLLALTKIRGITATAETEQKITKETFNYDPKHEVHVSNTRICPGNDFTIWTRRGTKVFRPHCKKGIIQDSIVYPYGWKFDEDKYPLQMLPEDSTNVQRM